MIDVFLIHGIGKRGSSTAPFHKLTEGVYKHLPKTADVTFHGIDYSPLLDRREEEIYGWVKDMSGPLDFFAKREREFICFYVCDVLAYAFPKKEPTEGDFMHDLTVLLGRELSVARKGAKIVLIGHSLGSIVGYGATWDIKTDCLITMGSPFSFFSIRYKDGGEMNHNLPQFHNFWSSRDRVSTVISKNPKFKSVKDYQVESWNPLKSTRIGRHSIYWESKFVHKKIADILGKL